jgi:hypothetical protein
MRWAWSDNPAYALRKPAPLEPACHDGSPMLDVLCSACRTVGHVHETGVAAAPAESAIATRCTGCGEMLVFEPGFLQAGFSELRRRGWVKA